MFAFSHVTPMGVLEFVGIVIWIAVALITNAWLVATYLKAEARQLTMMSVKETFNGFHVLVVRPIEIRNPLTFVWAFVYTLALIASAYLWLATGWQGQLVLMLIAGVVFAGLTVRWLWEFNESEEIRTRSLPSRYPIRVDMVN